MPGPNVFSSSAGAAAEATWPPGTHPDALQGHGRRWLREVERMRAFLGWSAEPLVERLRAGATGTPRAGTVYQALFVPAPVDQLDAAVAVTEHAWAVAAARGAPPPSVDAEIAALAAGERDTGLVRLLDEADRRGLIATVDDEWVGVGAGARGRAWPRGALPDVTGGPWEALGNVPVALVTGSNGKTTVVRLAAAILRAAGHTTGMSTTDGVRVDAPDAAPGGAHEALEDGDWAGPGGARRVLRDARVTAAVLETARGGILRRGLAVRRATAAVVTNAADDHLGEGGVESLDDVADLKLVVARALRDPASTLVAPADDATLAPRVAALARASRFGVCWTQARPDDADAAARVADAVARGGRACVVHAGAAGEELRDFDGRRWHALGRVDELPVTAGGLARHNVANAASAAALALALGAPRGAVRAGLRAFGAGARDNPGRLERFAVGGATVVVDYAHNPDGLLALHAATGALPAARRLLLLGQAGDRDDAALAALARAGWGGGRIDRVVLKELGTMRRGRARGEVSARLRAALVDVGAPPEAIDEAPSELEGVRRSLAWARPGDLLLLPLHEVREEVVAWLGALASSGWRAEEPVPEIGA